MLKELELKIAQERRELYYKYKDIKCPICGENLSEVSAFDPEEYGFDELRFYCHNCDFDVFGNGEYIAYVLLKLQHQEILLSELKIKE